MFKFALILSTLLCPAIQSFAQTPQKEGTAIVAGQVVLKGEAVRGATVALQPNSNNSRFELKNVLRTKTDDAGRFRFEKIKAGRYFLGAIAPGYVAPSDNAYGPQGKAINISEGENADSIEIALKVGGVITGRVADSQGNPVVSQSVELTRLNEKGKPERLFLGPNGMFYSTDDRGIYRLYGLPAGRYLVSVGFEQRPNSITMTMDRVFYPQTYYPDANSEAQAKVVEVSEGNESTGIDITVGGLKRNFDVAGRATYVETGQPAIGVEIQYGSMNSSGKSIGASASMGERTNSAGEFRLQSILPGKYAVFAQPEKNDESYSEAVPFEINDADVNGVELKLRRGASISGTAVLEGVADPTISAKLSQLQLSAYVASQELSSPRAGNVTIAANGSFRFNGLRAGKAIISISYDSAGRGFSIIRIERGGALSNDSLDVGAGEQVTGVRVVLGYGTGVVRGQLKTIGVGLPETVRPFVKARRIDSGLVIGNEASIDASGLFRMENLPPGEYEIYLGSYYRSDEPPPGYEELNDKLKTVKRRIAVANDTEVQVTLTLDLSQKENNE